MTMVRQCTRRIVIGSFEKGALPLIEIPFQIGSLPNENGAELFSITVHLLPGKRKQTLEVCTECTITEKSSDTSSFGR